MDHGPISDDRRLDEPFGRARETPVIGASQARPIIMVLGMHRSGTSLCAHALSTLGVEMTDSLLAPGSQGPAPDNPRGHWERWDIVALHDRILTRLNRGFYSPFHDFALPVAWWSDPDIVRIRHEITGAIEARLTRAPFGVKDPRSMRLMPLWHQLSTELNLVPKIILCLRNPAEVARSLLVRDRIERKIGEYRWLVHMVDFFRYCGASEFCVVEYEKWFDHPRHNYDKLAKFLDLETRQSPADIDATLAELVDPDLRHDGSRLIEAGHPLIRSLYRLAARADHDPAARDEAQYIVSQFVTFEQLQRPFVRSYEEQSAELEQARHEADTIRTSLAEAAHQRDAHAVALETHHAEIATLRSLLDDRDTVIRQAEAQISLTGQQLIDARAEIERARSAGDAELSALRSTLEQREAQIHAAEAQRSLAEQRTSEIQADAERERDERAASMAILQVELSALRSTLDQREANDALLQARLHETDAALQREREQHAAVSEAHRALAERRSADLERDRNERVAAVAALEAELAASRSALEQREAQDAQAQARRREEEAAFRHERERQTAAWEALVGEISALRSTLNERESQTRSAEAQQALAEQRISDKETELQREREQRDATTSTLQAEISTLRSTVEELQAAVTQAQAQKALVEMQLGEIKHEGSAAAATRLAAINSLRVKLGECETEPGESEELATDTEEPWLALKAAGDIRALEQRSDLHKADLEIVQRQADQLLAALQAERAECASQMDAMRRELRSRDARIAAVQHENLALSGELAAARHVGKAMLSTIRLAAASQPLGARSVATN